MSVPFALVLSPPSSPYHGTILHIFRLSSFQILPPRTLRCMYSRSSLHWPSLRRRWSLLLVAFPVDKPNAPTSSRVSTRNKRVPWYQEAPPSLAPSKTITTTAATLLGQPRSRDEPAAKMLPFSQIGLFLSFDYNATGTLRSGSSLVVVPRRCAAVSVDVRPCIILCSDPVIVSWRRLPTCTFHCRHRLCQVLVGLEAARFSRCNLLTSFATVIPSALLERKPSRTTPKTRPPLDAIPTLENDTYLPTTSQRGP
jgi:hypothetical protein